jgi:hypothetical protein
MLKCRKGWGQTELQPLQDYDQSTNRAFRAGTCRGSAELFQVHIVAVVALKPAIGILAVPLSSSGYLIRKRLSSRRVVQLGRAFPNCMVHVHMRAGQFFWRVTDARGERKIMTSIRNNGRQSNRAGCKIWCRRALFRSACRPTQGFPRQITFLTFVQLVPCEGRMLLGRKPLERPE